MDKLLFMMNNDKKKTENANKFLKFFCDQFGKIYSVTTVLMIQKIHAK